MKHVITSSTTASNTILAGSQTGVALELYGEPSLLPLFKPELAPDIPAPTKPTATGGKAATTILERLKAKKAEANK